VSHISETGSRLPRLAILRHPVWNDILNALSNDGVIWDRKAETFGDEPDHGLRDPSVRDVALLTGCDTSGS